MEKMYEKFRKYIDNEDKENAVLYILDQLQNNKIAITDIYSKFLEPALNNMTCDINKNVCIWKEHVRSSIIRTIIECCYPYVIRLRDTKGYKKAEKVVIVCPDGESHELGARIISDIFTLYGYNTLFVGANTPKNDFIDVINIIKPSYVAISVTNLYNLFTAKKIIQEIKAKINYDMKLIVGGNAFKGQTDLYKDIGADICINSQKELIEKIISWGRKG